MSTSAHCVIGDSKHETDHGHLCEHHYNELRRTLAELETEAAILSAQPSLEQRQSNRSGAPAFTRAPARIDVICLTDPRRGQMRWGSDDFDELGLDDTPSVLETLHSWANMVREEQKITTPTRITLSGERELLDRQLPWIAGQDWIDEAYAAFRQLLGQIRSVNGTSNPKPIARCLHCPDGQVWRSNTWRTVWRVQHDRCERLNVAAPDGPAYCDTCGAHWDDADGMHRLELAEEQRRREAARPHTTDGRPMLTAEELVAKGVMSSINNVRVTAHRRRIISVDRHYDPDAFADRKVSA
jgi:hypothetical protein